MSKVLVAMAMAAFFLFQFSLTAAEVKEIGDIFGLPKDQVVVSNVSFTKVKDGVLFSFKKGGSLNVMGYFYDEIDEGGKLKLSRKAIPIEAAFIGMGNYRFPGIPEFELKNKTKILFKENTLTIFAELNEELMQVKEKPTKATCKAKCGFDANCWKLKWNNDTLTLCEEKTEEELIQEGVLRKTDEGLFYVDKEFIAKDVFFYPPFQLNVKVIEGKLEVFNHTFNGSNFKIDEVDVSGTDNLPGLAIVEKEGLFFEGITRYKGTTIIGAYFLNPKDQVNKSWVKIDSDFIEAKSITPLYIKIMYDNELFDVDNGALEFTLELDYIKATSRKQQNLVPLIQHNGFEKGRTKIKTGIFTFTLEEKGLQVEKISLIKDFLKKFFKSELPTMSKSVAFELFSNLIGGKRLIVGSGNNYILSSELANGALTMNPWGIPVTNNREYNLLTTVEQLQEKWKERGIKFEARSWPVDPGSVQLVNYWLEKRPEVKLDRIVFVRDLNAFAAEMPTWEVEEEKNGKIKVRNEIVMGVGAYIMDPYSVEEFLGKVEIRPFDPLKTLDHEYQHAQEYYLKREDYKNFEEKARAEAEKRVSLEDGVKLFLDRYKRSSKMIAENIHDLKVWMKERNFEVLLARVKQWYGQDFNYELPAELIKKHNLPKDIRELRFEEVPQEAILELASLTIEKMEKFKANEEWRYNYYTKKFKENKEEFLKEHKDILSFYKKIVEKEKMPEVMKELGEKEFKQKSKDYIGVVLNKVGDDFLTQLREDFLYKSRLEKINRVLRDKALEKPPGSEERKSFETAIEKIKIETSPIEILKVLRSFMDDGIVAKEALLFQKEVERYAPAVYSFRKYSNPIHGESYEELLTTLVELPEEERISKARFYPNYKKLEQIVFDTGSIFSSPEFYQQIFGPCKMRDCLDKRCIIYKGECCKKFPNSPNC